MDPKKQLEEYRRKHRERRDKEKKEAEEARKEAEEAERKAEEEAAFLMRVGDMICLNPERLAAARIVNWVKKRPSRTQLFVNITQDEADQIPGLYLYRTIRHGDLWGFDLRTIQEYAYLFEDEEWQSIQRQRRLIDTTTTCGNRFRIVLEFSRSLAVDMGKELTRSSN